jgi:hypothetical protein
MPFRRKPPPGNVRRVIGLGNNFRGVTTNKRGHLVQFESEQEHKLLLLLERDRTVADYRSQPETLLFQDTTGRQRKYTPDFQVWRTGGRIELHEVTLVSRREHHASFAEREAAAREICQARGWHYLVHTEETLPSAWEYANLNCLAAFRAETYASSEYQAWWFEQLVGKESVHPRTVLAPTASIVESGSLLNTLYYLLWHGAVQMDWCQPLFWRTDFHPRARIWVTTPPSMKEFAP